VVKEITPVSGFQERREEVMMIGLSERSGADLIKLLPLGT